MIQLTLTLKMTTAQVVETSVTVNNNLTVLFRTTVTGTIKLNLLLTILYIMLIFIIEFWEVTITIAYWSAADMKSSKVSRCYFWVKTRSYRRMPGHIREFNRLEPHSNHDSVFKIWRDYKTEATLRVVCYCFWVTRNQILMGNTGILILRNIKFKILPLINASLSDFTGFFALKTNQKIAIFVWISSE